MLHKDAKIVFSTSGRHHFFGYYDKCPWSADGRYFLAHRTDLVDRLPKPEDGAEVVVFDVQSGTERKIAETRAWNFQQGAMLQWLGPDFNSKIIFNDFQSGGFVSVIIDIHTGERNSIPYPVYAVHPSGEFALSLDFSLLDRVREGYGYKGGVISSEELVYLSGLKGNPQKIPMIQDASLHIGQSIDAVDPNGKHWVDHLTFNPSGTSFAFLHRMPLEGGGFASYLFTARTDGKVIIGTPEILLESGMASHLAWKNDLELVIWGRPPGLASRVGKRNVLRKIAAPIYHALIRSPAMRQKLSGDALLLFDVNTRDPQKIGEGVLVEDGHSTFSPDRKWLLTDTYADKEHHRRLLLYRVSSGTLIEVGGFYSLPKNVENKWDSSGLRADLHPRWNRDGTQVCIDSVHEGTRQMYVIDVSKIVR